MVYVRHQVELKSSDGCVISEAPSAADFHTKLRYSGFQFAMMVALVNSQTPQAGGKRPCVEIAVTSIASVCPSREPAASLAQHPLLAPLLPAMSAAAMKKGQPPVAAK